MFNNIYPYYNNALSQSQGFKVLPIPKIEEAQTIYPDFNGNPLFLYDQTKNEIFVKQRNIETGAVQMFKYILSKEPLNVSKISENKKYDSEIEALKIELSDLRTMLEPKKKVRNDEEEE